MVKSSYQNDCAAARRARPLLGIGMYPRTFRFLRAVRTHLMAARYVLLAALKSLGFKSSNDSTLIGVLKTAGLIDSSGVPTSIWSSYRGTHHKKVLGDALRMGYAELFAVYPAAWQRPNSDLEHVFSTSSSAGKQVIAKTVATFKALCECAEFGPPGEQAAPALQSGPLHSPVAQPLASGTPKSSGHAPNPSVHIDIQIHISPEASTDQIDQIFKSMAKHLYGTKDA